MMTLDEACCTCARSLSALKPQYDEKTEKPVAEERRLECCGRIVCCQCIARNSRFADYCPFCQITNGPSLLPQGLYDPPTYSPSTLPPSHHQLTDATPNDESPPAYTTTVPIYSSNEKQAQEPSAEDVLHFLDPSQDTIPSLALRYAVPIDALRRKNTIFADHLLAARKTILIPGEFYKGGVSLSPTPIVDEEEEKRKTRVRRWMVKCKVHDYDVAVLYLEQASYDLDKAVEAYLADERWEHEHPMAEKSRSKDGKPPRRRRADFGSGLTGQL